MREAVTKEDYEEPNCPLCMDSAVTPIPVSRVIEKLDFYFHKNDLPSAERHLAYWKSEAQAGHDDRGLLTVLNEQAGLYRKLGKGRESIAAAQEALGLIEGLGLSGTVTMATTLINAATAYKAFSDAEKAVPLYEKAKGIYEALLPKNDARLAGLYNNMALSVMATGDYGAAERLFELALAVLRENENAEGEAAVTCCNLADLYAAKYGLEDGAEKINECLDRALALLETPTLPRDGNYAFICEKCAPVFGYYGYFMAERELSRLSKEIYDRT